MVRACLTVVATLGGYLDDICIVGGFVPSLLVPETANADGGAYADHPGTTDLDVGLATALLDDRRYDEISERLRQERFRPDTNGAGNLVLQRWHHGGVTVDFLIPPTSHTQPGRRIQALDGELGAVVTPGLELAFEERMQVEIEGRTLTGVEIRREVPVCGPAAFTVLKALAFADRGEPKDAYDLVYVIKRWPGGVEAIADRLHAHAVRHASVVERALELLRRDFEHPAALGPMRAVDFDGVSAARHADAAADAHGHVDDLVRAVARRGL